MTATKAILILSFLLTSTIYSLAQDTIYMNNRGGKTTRENADYLRLYTPEGNMFLVEDYYPSGEIKMYGHSLYGDTLIRMGPFKYYSKAGIISNEGSFDNNRQVGEWKTYREGGILKMVENYNSKGKQDGLFLVYYPNGNLKRQDRYKDDELVEKKCFGIDGSDTTWFEYYSYPTFNGGDRARIDFVNANITYPQYAREAGLQGTVYVNFIVQKSGKLSNIRILRGIHESLDNEAIRVVQLMPDWIPGKMDGELVNVEFNLPVRFSLGDFGPTNYQKKNRH